MYVSGELGSAAAGLYLLQHEQRENPQLEAAAYPHLVRRHLDPTPRVQLGQQLRESGMVTAMQDISDGIATDLSHICTASKVAAVIEAGALPADEQLVEVCARLQLDPASFQVRGGEDYELLFTVRKGHERQLTERIRANCGTKIFRIGTIIAGEGVTMLSPSGAETSITYQGYEHRS